LLAISLLLNRRSSLSQSGGTQGLLLRNLFPGHGMNRITVCKIPRGFPEEERDEQASTDLDGSLTGWSGAGLRASCRGQQEPDWSKVQIKTTKVSGISTCWKGQGGNIAASVGEDGIVIVDDQFAPLAEKSRPR